MPRARSNRTNYRQTAAAYKEGSGCLSGFMLPPLAVLCISAFLAFFALKSPAQATANSPMPAFSPAGLAPLFTPEVQYWRASILRWTAHSNLDPNLAAVVMQIESCGDPRAHSRAGAMGLFQVMPYHFYVIDNPYDPDTNARRGLAYLQRSLERAGGNIHLALAGYNGGISVIGRSEWTWAAETIRYVYWGEGIYADAVQGAAQSSRLDEWLRAGGASLCRQARGRLGLGN